VGGFLEVPYDELALRWTAVTRGGRIDKTAYGLNLRLKGVRAVPESKAGLDAHAATLQTVEERLHGLSKTFAPAELREALAAVESILKALEETERAGEPANLCGLVQEVVSDMTPELQRAGITIDLWCDSAIPPIPLRRDRMRAFFVNALRWAATELLAGGSVSLLVDYDARGRLAGIVLALNGLRGPLKDRARVASLRRSVVEVHGGRLDLESTDTSATLTATLPDSIGRCLDEWIPGWDAFGDRSRQMLRVLKSGGPTPPEDFMLEGVLEDELERWLLPKLEAPAAVNLAHELTTDHPDLPGSSPERLEKALGQIRKRKPRKEVVRPAYAAEILWAYRDDARSRSAVGTENLELGQLRALCEALLKRPPDYVVALRLLARTLRPNE
jgi:hypothetical protein